jgi:hypothetical protein
MHLPKVQQVSVRPRKEEVILAVPIECDQKLDEVKVVFCGESLQIRNLSIEGFVIVMA